ncbi:hypothetical protein HN51_044322 [Arachis hypogaea]
MTLVHISAADWRYAAEQFVKKLPDKVIVHRKLEERDLFLCASSVLFCKAMIEASLFSSLEHSRSFTRDLWFNKSPIHSWLDTFSAHRHSSDAITIARGDVSARIKAAWLYFYLP